MSIIWFKIEKINNWVIDSVSTAHYGHTPSLIINIKDINEESIGELITFFYLAASMSAVLFVVNPFDQPGVEAYKSEIKKRLV